MAQMDITPIGTTDEVSALPLQSNYVEIVSKYNAHDIAVTDVHGITSPDVILSKQDIDDLIIRYYPIGFLRYCWEGSAEAQGLIDTGRFVELEGQKLGETWSESPYYQVFAVSNLPNLDQCFIVGVTAQPPITTIKANTKNLYHIHTNSHTHTIANHTHTFVHRHFITSGAYVEVNFRNDGQIFVNKTISTQYNGTNSYYRGSANTGTDGEVQEQYTALSINGITNYTTLTSTSSTTSTGSTDTQTETITYSLSSTQEVLPKYSKVKAYLRIL